jgi:hypothetical protein
VGVARVDDSNSQNNAEAAEEDLKHGGAGKRDLSASRKYSNILVK